MTNTDTNVVEQELRDRLRFLLREFYAKYKEYPQEQRHEAYVQFMDKEYIPLDDELEKMIQAALLKGAR